MKASEVTERGFYWTTQYDGSPTVVEAYPLHRKEQGFSFWWIGDECESSVEEMEKRGKELHGPIPLPLKED